MNIVTLITNIRDWCLRNSKLLIFILIVLVGTTIAHSLFKKENNLALPQTIVDYKEVQKWKDKYDNEHSKITQLVFDKESFKRRADSIAKLLGTKPSDVQSVTSVTTKGDVKVETETVYVDSTKTYLFSDSTNYYALTGKLNTNTKKVNLDFGTVDTLTIVPYKKRRFFKETFAVDVTNKNPYNHIVSGYSYTSSERVKRFGIGPQVGYDPVNKRITYGIGIQYNIIRF